MRNIIIASSLLLASGYACSEVKAPTYNQFNLGYSFTEDDSLPERDSKGISWNFTYEFTEDFFFGIGRFEQESTINSAFKITFEDYQLGYIYDLSVNSSMYVVATSSNFVTIDYASATDDRFNSKAKSVGIGYRNRINNDWEFGLEALETHYELFSDPDNKETEREGQVYVTYFLDEDLGIGFLYTGRLAEDFYGLQLRFSF